MTTQTAQQARTTAQRIAAAFGDDGQTDLANVSDVVAQGFDAGEDFGAEGDTVSMSDICESLCATHDSGSDHGHSGMDRYTFADGSAITMAGSWDIGFADCWCWQGAGHNDDCAAA